MDINNAKEAYYLEPTPGQAFFYSREQQAVFTGDVLLIRGSGRTDFQGGDPHKSYDSIVKKLFRLPD